MDRPARGLHRLPIHALAAVALLAAAAHAQTPDPDPPAVGFDLAPARTDHNLPLSDQADTQQWRLREDLSDPFDADRPDTRRWRLNHPGWKGRRPTFFHRANIQLADGELVLHINRHGDQPLPEGYTHSAAFLRSRTPIRYGYFEAELKLMDAPWVSCFWLSNHQPDWWTEIDICENCPSENNQQHDLNTNLHVFHAPPEHGDVKEHFARARKFRVPFSLHDDYHVWGLDWNPDTIRFYLDGVLVREAENTHWHQPLHINLNNESNPWFGALPDDARTDRRFHIRYLRVWQRDGAPTPTIDHH